MDPTTGGRDRLTPRAAPHLGPSRPVVSGEVTGEVEVTGEAGAALVAGLVEQAAASTTPALITVVEALLERLRAGQQARAVLAQLPASVLREGIAAGSTPRPNLTPVPGPGIRPGPGRGPRPDPGQPAQTSPASPAQAS